MRCLKFLDTKNPLPFPPGLQIGSGCEQGGKRRNVSAGWSQPRDGLGSQHSWECYLTPYFPTDACQPDHGPSLAPQPWAARGQVGECSVVRGDFALCLPALRESQPQGGDSSLMIVTVNPDISLPNNFDLGGRGLISGLVHWSCGLQSGG